ncbi:MAG: branched-chain amino acid ABC transporter permease [Chloroflexota bacterium]
MTGILRQNRSLLVALGVVALVVFWLTQQYEPRVTASILLSGLTLGALFFLVTSGLSLIFGLMDVLNFAHGLFFMIGAYFGYTLYANPRMILNALPFALAMGGGIAIGGYIAALLRSASLSPTIERVVTGGLIGLGGALFLAGVWGFDLLTLAASGATATGGEVATDVAQEASSTFLVRLVLLAASGLLIGFALARRQRGTSRIALPTWRGLAGGLAAIVLAVALTYWRTPGEEFILGLSSNLRFVLALVVGGLGGAALGALVEWSMIRPLYSRPIYQVLLTLGLVFVGTEVVKSIWGPTAYFMEMPSFFNTRGPNCPSPNLLAFLQDNCASIDVLGRPFPSYRIFIIALGIVVFAAVALLLRRTRMGMIIRAGVQDRDMVQALGINVRRVFTLVFALGTGLAALGGVAAAPFVGVNPGLGQEFILLAFISVVIGGMGSYSGAALGALLVGLARAVGDQLVLSGIHLPGIEEAVKLSPSIARASTVLLMAAVLLIRPAGLFGKKDT